MLLPYQFLIQVYYLILDHICRINRAEYNISKENKLSFWDVRIPDTRIWFPFSLPLNAPDCYEWLVFGNYTDGTAGLRH